MFGELNLISQTLIKKKIFQLETYTLNLSPEWSLKDNFLSCFDVDSTRFLIEWFNNRNINILRINTCKNI